MTEEWRRIPDHPNYEVSSLGRVRSVDREVRGPYGTTRKLKGKPIKLQVRPDGYLQFQVRRGTTVYVHRAVALAFLGPEPAGLEVCHNDGDPKPCANAQLSVRRHPERTFEEEAARYYERYRRVALL